MKSIFVHIDASPRSAERLTIACSLARRHRAELEVGYGVLPSLLATPWVSEHLDTNVIALMAEADAVQRERAKALFDRLAADLGARWSDCSQDSTYWQIVQRALLSDLLVMGQTDPEDRSTGALPPDLVPAAIFDSGKPTLVVPSSGVFESLPEAVLLAWKPTRESARAVTAALPWLTLARRVHLACAPEGGELAYEGVEHWMRLHGVGADFVRHHLQGSDVGEDLLTLAAESGAGLLAMGCYGHSRTREWALGGVTRTVLRSMTLPTLLVH